MRRSSVRTRGRLLGTGLALVTTMVTLTWAAGPAQADPVTYTGSDGVVYEAMAPSAYLADPRVLGVQKGMQAIADGPFRGGWDEQFDDNPDATWIATHRGDWTRLRERHGKKYVITMVSAKRECTRTATSRHSADLKFDARSSWSCAKINKKSPRPFDIINAHLPLSVVSANDDADLTVLLPQAPATAADPELRVLVKRTDVLTSLGLRGGPSQYYVFTADAKSATSTWSEFDGNAWLLGEMVLDSTYVPRLADMP